MFDHRIVALASTVLLVAATLSSVAGVSVAAYDPGTTPEQLVTEPFAERNLRKVVPAADEFSEPTGPYKTVRAYEVVDGERRLVGYVFLTSNVVDTVGFSDRPVEFLVGIDTEGTITGVQLVEQHEPFFQRRATRTRLRELADQLIGLSATRDVVFEDPDADDYEVDAITRATVTSEVTVETIMRSSRLVARRQGLVSEAGGGSDANDTAENRTEAEEARASGTNRTEVRQLATTDSLERWNVSTSALGLRHDAGPVALYVAPLDSGAIGDRLLGAQRHDRLRNRWPETTLVWIGLDGVPDGWDADTLVVRQHARQFDATPVSSSVRGVDWSAVVVVRAERFDPTRPFAVAITSDGRTASRTYVPPGTGTVTTLVARMTPDWLHEVRGAWERAWPESLLLVVGLSLVAGLFALRRHLLASDELDVSYDAVRHVVLAVSLLFIGWYRPAQPTSQQLDTFLRETITWVTGGGFDWVLFFSMPLIVLVLGFFALTAVVWGRGTFCGWVCPFGALSELLYRLTPWEYELPRRYHERLEKLRYPLFVLIVAGFLVSTSLGATLAKVEPFKAAFYYSLVTNPFYVGWSLLLVVASAVAFRPYCRYLCPLGAGLSFGNVLQQREIQRYDLCGDCVKCQTDCEFQAIRDDGSIARQQCFQCSVCVENYYDPDGCPVLLQYDPEDGDWSAAWEDPELIERIRPADRTREQRRIIEAAMEADGGVSDSGTSDADLIGVDVRSDRTDPGDHPDASTEWDDESSISDWPTDARHDGGDDDA